MASPNSASVQAPMPAVSSGEMFGAWKVPNGLFSARPPARTSFWSSAAPGAA
jgi:hypothetical protein